MRYCSHLIFLFLLFALPTTCFSGPVKVVSVTDDDTITVLHNDQQKEIRLYEIECPEKVPSHSEQAKALTPALFAGRNVDVEHKDRS
jgi:endonuclease YncB( thermonuclease family)